MILGAIMVYLLFSKGFWMDRFMGESLIHQDDKGVPHITPLKKKVQKPKKKRVYKKRSKKK
jgi:uncharacterized membrane protein